MDSEAECVSDSLVDVGSARGTLSAASVRARWARTVVRVEGSWIAAIGLLMLGWAIRVAA